MFGIDFTIIIGLAATTVGVMEYVKGFIPESIRQKIPSNVYRLVLALVAAGISVASGGDLNAMVLNGLAVVATSQMGYEAFLRFLKSKITKTTDAVSDKPEGV